MAEKTLKTRLIQKHDTESNWRFATNFVPKDGELIIYEIDSEHPIPRMKVGDGETNVNDLPFVNNIYVGTEDPGVNSGMIWFDTNEVNVASVEGVEF